MRVKLVIRPQVLQPLWKRVPLHLFRNRVLLLQLLFLDAHVLLEPMMVSGAPLARKYFLVLIPDQVLMEGFGFMEGHYCSKI